MRHIYRRRRRRILITLASLFLVFIIAFTGVAAYLGDYYEADEEGLSQIMSENTRTFKTSIDTTVFINASAKYGLIFYPGAKIDESAYMPLMQACHNAGIFCVLVRMPFRLAFLNYNVADEVIKMHPGITEWYIGGHSLGGAMAAACLKNTELDYAGLILLGSYSASDLSDTSLSVLSIYGSEDEILDMEKYEKNKENLPKDFTEIVIDGGCHSYFGMYGMQKGDGTPTITNVQQIEMTADYISEFILGK